MWICQKRNGFIMGVRVFWGAWCMAGFVVLVDDWCVAGLLSRKKNPIEFPRGRNHFKLSGSLTSWWLRIEYSMNTRNSRLLWARICRARCLSFPFAVEKKKCVIQTLTAMSGNRFTGVISSLLTHSPFRARHFLGHPAFSRSRAQLTDLPPCPPWRVTRI